ncbi:glycosyltransferase family 76 [Lecanosticta acicola]|uniref:GPI mannosyltransferase 2 n=1 Tax=Lecanosticta acicola TaxID=111012 RepID=A0AAI8Z4Q7_9PEZI|nr:glycosyltransferase family 76 [Lecanosticta acicola]
MDQPQSGLPSPPSPAVRKPNANANAVDTNPTRLLAFYGTWKCFLLIVAAASPGPGYDTSTQILFRQHADTATSSQSSLTAILHHIEAKLTRWDAIYFTTSSQRGLLYEQEWAFSPTYAIATSTIARIFPFVSTSSITNHALAGILFSHIAHYLTAIALYRLAYQLLPSNDGEKRRIAFIASCLHILSPGGLFLSAPYAESTFAALNFWGSYAYFLHSRSHPRGIAEAIFAACGLVAAGGCFGAASLIRSNGILSGLVLAWDAMACLPKIPAIIQQRLWPQLIQLLGVLTGGVVLACLYAIPQTSAYLEYCTNGNTRPWCENVLPSIYTWVQEHYWGVGFLRYWTLSNLPLFLLAAPMLGVLLLTGYVALTRSELITSTHYALNHGGKTKPTAGETRAFTHAMARFALPQVVLAMLALTNFHVQIINRISSGYPVWYIVLAIAMHGAAAAAPEARKSTPILNWLSRKSEWIVRGAIMYAVIQGGLYASFMPPA